MFTKSPLGLPKLRFKGFSGEWEEKKIKDVLDYEQPTKYLVDSENYEDDKNLLPVLTAGKSFILGYTKNYENRYDKGDVIIIDDFTLDIRYINFSFKVKSSAIKFLTSQNNNLFFIFLLLLKNKIKPIGHNRHYISIVQNTIIHFPSLSEQSKIATFFSLLDKQIELWEKKLQLVELNTKKYLSILFTKKYHFAKFDTNWKYTILNDAIIKISTGINPRNHFKLNDGGDKHYITIKNIKNNNIFINNNTDFIDDKAFHIINKRSNIEIGDILLPSIYDKKHIGESYIIKEFDGKWNINESLFIIKLNKEIFYNDFFVYVLKSLNFKQFVQSKIKGSSFKSLKLNDLKKYKFYLPEMEEQKTISNFFLLQYQNINLIGIKIYKLKKIKNGYLNNVLM